MRILQELEVPPGTILRDATGTFWIISVEGDAHALMDEPFRVWTADRCGKFAAEYGPFTITTRKETC